MRHILPALLLPLALAACLNETAIPDATSSGGRTGAVSRPPPPPRVTTYDGQWVGTITLNPDRTRECPRPPSAERTITVEGGRATLALNPQVRQTQTGHVNADGSVRMVDSLDRSIATTGLFAEGTFQGEYRNGLCTYAVRMTKR
ncbi:hypothetical protein JMJ55_24375 [Belnapia sp. T6]|uniref:Lipoprotein n=1 Tax=Belnapia mucosa TaxID=2804532 RepID=A0ABS1VA01_9PROT|nr:hypothetical protein [Belnapia mucosa]MBL6458478.1 hypothetical protein [Belnapia mucosa]